MIYRTPTLGAKVYVKAYKRPLTVRARNRRFAICTRPAFGSVLYFVLDTHRGVRGPENLIFGRGAETDEQCHEMLIRLTAGRSEVTHRNCVPWDVEKVVNP